MFQSVGPNAHAGPLCFGLSWSDFVSSFCIPPPPPYPPSCLGLVRSIRCHEHIKPCGLRGIRCPENNLQNALSLSIATCPPESYCSPYTDPTKPMARAEMTTQLLSCHQRVVQIKNKSQVITKSILGVPHAPKLGTA